MEKFTVSAFVVFSVVLSFQTPSCHGYIVDNNPYRHFESLDPNGRYDLEWLVDWEQERVIFNVTVQTRGYVGFGLSRRGKMTGADIVIGGVMPNGEPYFSDRYASGNQLPEEDARQDWTLISARETASTTYLTFSRPFDTCDDEHDIEIHDDVISIIWAFGENDDDIQYHFQNRGRFDAYILDPDLTPRIIQSEYRQKNPRALGNTRIWTIPGTQRIPPQDTTYLCSIHKAPTTRKNHILGFNSIVPTALDRKHIHHFLLHRCHAPVGQDPRTVFQRFHDSGTKEECYILTQPVGQIPTQHCREVVYVWEPNGKPFFLPDHVGIPISENGDDYYMLQMHFDNPEQLSGIQVNYTLEIFHTNELRQNDAGVLTIGEQTPASPSIMVPPNSLEHVMYGHCGGLCTDRIFPQEGIHVFAANLHTHLAGRGVRLIHIRDGRELPWVSYDNNYNFDYQQIRNLRRERTILPGDTLINRCVYENTDRNGSVTIGGFSSRHEMCNGFLWYYNRLPDHGVCRSEIRSESYRQFMQIYNTTWSNVRIENVVTAPERNAGLTVSEVGNFRINWTIQRRSTLQAMHRFLPQITQCPPTGPMDQESGPGGNNNLRGGRRSGSNNNSNSRGGVSAGRSPPLERYDATTRNNRRSQDLQNSRPSRDRVGTDERIVNPDYEQEIRNAPGEIQDPEYEFVTVYPRNIVPYERVRTCRRRNRQNY